MIKIEVWSNLNRRPVDVIIAPISPHPQDRIGWNYPTDLAIKKLAGLKYHSKLHVHYLQGKLSETFLGIGSREGHDGVFNHVVFLPMLGISLKYQILTRAIYFSHKNSFNDILVPLSPHWLEEVHYMGVPEGLPGCSLEILKMGLVLAEENIRNLNLTINFAPSCHCRWCLILLTELRKEYKLELWREKLTSFRRLIKGFLGQT